MLWPITATDIDVPRHAASLAWVKGVTVSSRSRAAPVCVFIGLCDAHACMCTAVHVFTLSVMHMHACQCMHMTTSHMHACKPLRVWGEVNPSCAAGHMYVSPTAESKQTRRIHYKVKHEGPSRAQ